MQETPAFTYGQREALRTFIKKQIVTGDKEDTLLKIEHGKIKPSKQLQDALLNMLKGNQEFVMLDEQKVVYESILNIGKKKLISFCVDTGFTCFGLVEQNYELPEEILHEMGVHTIPVPRAEVSRTGVNTTAIDTQIQRAEYETIDITVLKRGIIGVNKIGYAPV